MTGWEKCEQLKKIRKLIAEANDIPYEIEECEHLEECIGTCPKCEAEVEYINRALTYRAKSGKKIVVDGLLGELFPETEGIASEKNGKQSNRKAGNAKSRNGKKKHQEDSQEYYSKGSIYIDDVIDDDLPFC